MAKSFNIPFAAIGDRTTISNTDQGEGVISYPRGYGTDFGRPPTDPQKSRIKRDGMNSLFYDLTDAVGFDQKHGYSEWSASFAPYPANVTVWDDGKVWRSAIANNNDRPSLPPDPENNTWADVTWGSVPQATPVIYGTVRIFTSIPADGNTSLDDRSATVGAVRKMMSRILTVDTIGASGGDLVTNRDYSILKVNSGFNISIQVRLPQGLNNGDCATVCVLLDKTNMTGAPPSLTITAEGAGAVVLKPKGASLAISQTGEFDMLYITTMYVDGRQVVTCNIQEWESV